jgi:hypothetical protein
LYAHTLKNFKEGNSGTLHCMPRCGICNHAWGAHPIRMTGIS